MPESQRTFQSMDPVTQAPAAAAQSATPAGAPLAPADAPPDERARPTPHKSKLVELRVNPKLPQQDVEQVEQALADYERWVAHMAELDAQGDEKVEALVTSLNGYKRQIELDLIWDSPQDFLYRQRGQTKIDNSIIEEFLPWLVDVDIIPELADLDIFAGPAAAFAAAYFGTTLTGSAAGVGLRLRTKDQDFTLSRQAFLKASFDPEFPARDSSMQGLWLAYVAAECKTNLDKTMFQEATATAHDLKVAMPAARYYLICEFLDMRPISTAGTDIDEVLILRGKRLPSNKRNQYASAATRQQRRDEYIEFLDANPVRYPVVLRFVEHLRGLFTKEDPDEGDVVAKGYF